MKQNLLGRLAAAAVLLLSATTASAHDFEVDGIYYNKDDGSKTASVTCKGYYYYDYVNEYSGAVTIPSEVTYEGTTYSVTTIGSSAFRNCSGLTSVEIPNSVTSIGISAFCGCSGLTSVEIPNSVTSIEWFAFYGCSSLTSVEIPNSVTSIEWSAFDGCSGLTSVVIANSVTTIGNGAFYGCSGLKSVEIPNSVTSIGSFAFEGCSGLTSVVIGNSVTSIGYWAFRGCSDLTSVTSLNIIPPTLGSDVFYDVPADCVLYVPEGCVGAYQSADGWKDFGTIIEIQPVGVEGISKAETAKVRAVNGVIRVEGAEGARVEVYTAAGVCIYSGTDTEIYVPQRGLYVVKVAGRATKLAM